MKDTGQPAPGALMMALFFSGGGTRAAAFSYGVLRELATVPLPSGGRLLDRVTTINAVSGGSFTAAYYCLFGDRIFADFERDFLKVDVQATLLRRCLTPFNSARLMSSRFGRSDLAAEYYDEILFHGATFGDLAKAAGPRPFLVINATNICTSTQWQFTQGQFDLIGSDLSRYPVSRAVAASSAVPFLFTPIVLQNQADRVSATDPVLVSPAASDDVFANHRTALEEVNRAYRDVGRHPYLFLMDGGLVDNLALRNLIDGVTLSGGWRSVMDGLRARGITRLAIIVVNAAVESRMEWAQRDETPSLENIIRSLSNATINRTNRETIGLVEASLAQWQKEQGADGAGLQPAIYFITVDFHSRSDPAERAFFDSVPTSFDLPPETVDRLVAAGGRLLRESLPYRSLLNDLSGEAAARRP